MSTNEWNQAAIQITAGGTAGFVEVCLMHPLDLIKTRLQLQRSNHEINTVFNEVYSGVTDCCKKMIKSEGVMSFWKGIFPPILAETPKRAIKFFTFEQYKKEFSKLNTNDKNMPYIYSMAGLTAGITEALIINPFEVVKINLQSDRSKFKETPSTRLITNEIWNTEGIRGFTKGLTATICRNGLFNMVYFGFYHSVKDYWPTASNDSWEFCRRLSIAFVSGVLASCINIPFDVVKSRIQGPQPVIDLVKYKSTWASLRIIYHEEGIRALYKGLFPKVLRLGPGGAIMLIVYDYMHGFLNYISLK